MIGAVVAIDTCAIIHLMHIQRFFLLKVLGYSVITTVYVQLEFEKGYASSREYFFKLLNTGEILRFPLEIDDLVAMANFHNSNLPNSKRVSDAELSCFVVANRIGGKVMTDDTEAIKYIKRYSSIPPEIVITLFDVLLEAYKNYWLLDHELRSIQETLSTKQFDFKYDLVVECARRRWMTE